MGFLGGRDPGRIPASHLFREIFVGKDRVGWLEVIRGVKEPLVCCYEGEGATKQELWRGFGGAFWMGIPFQKPSQCIDGEGWAGTAS